MRTTAEFAALAVLVVLLAAVTAEDLRSHTIPDRLNLLLLVSGLIFACMTPVPGLVASVIGVVAGGAFLAAVATGFHRLRGIDGLGFGDVKFLAGAGAWVGWQGLGPVVFLASISALVLVVGRRLVRGRFDRTAPIPFGPHLSLATIVVWSLQASGAAAWLDPVLDLSGAPLS